MTLVPTPPRSAPMTVVASVAHVCDPQGSCESEDHARLYFAGRAQEIDVWTGKLRFDYPGQHRPRQPRTTTYHPEPLRPWQPKLSGDQFV
jgi:hypothetical protein